MYLSSVVVVNLIGIDQQVCSSHSMEYSLESEDLSNCGTVVADNNASIESSDVSVVVSSHNSKADIQLTSIVSKNGDHDQTTDSPNCIGEKSITVVELDSSSSSQTAVAVLPTFSLPDDNAIRSSSSKLSNFFQTHLELSAVDPPDDENEDYKSLPVNQKRSVSFKSAISSRTCEKQQSQIKKAVRFADTFGLDLADVHTVCNLEEPPNVPPEALKDLHLNYSSSSNESSPENSESNIDKLRNKSHLIISPCFAQPFQSADFRSRVLSNKILLEKAKLIDNNTRISGNVMVANLDFTKVVFVRVTFNSWRSYQDIHTDYRFSSSDGWTDHFGFSFVLPEYFSVGSKAAFCVCMRCLGQEFWDNNSGSNYIFDCYSVSGSAENQPVAK